MYFGSELSGAFRCYKNNFVFPLHISYDNNVFQFL